MSEGPGDLYRGFLTPSTRRPSIASMRVGWLDLKKPFVKSPKIVVWNAVQEVSRMDTYQSSRQNKKRKPPQNVSGFLSYLISGLVLITLGLLTIIWKPNELLMTERLRMTRGLPPFQWWEEPPDEIILRMHVFNYTNTEAFLSGEDDFLQVEDVGPFIFREKLQHVNVTKNANGTLSYTAIREAIYLPEMNTLNIDDTIITPNLAVLGMASYLWDASIITKLGYNVLLKRVGSSPFKEVSVYDYFWNLTDPLSDIGRKFLPMIVPGNNFGVLYQIYKDFTDRFTVYIGVERGDREFFKIDRFNGNKGMSLWDREECDSVQGSSEGASYHQRVRKEDEIKYLRKTICRAPPLFFTKELRYGDFKAFKFELPNETFSRPPPESGEQECFHNAKYPLLKSGLSDVSPCWYTFPVASSFPHFMHADPSVYEKIRGLNPDREKHGSYIILEPISGVPFTQKARSQSNLMIHPLSGIPSLKKFSNIPLPMFWAEYHQVSIPWYVRWLLYFSVVFLPSFQLYISIFMAVLGLSFLFISFQRIRSRWRLANYTSIHVAHAPINNL